MIDTERQTWSLRIEHWFNKQLSALLRENADTHTWIKRELRRRAVESLGLTEYETRLTELEQSMKEAKQGPMRLLMVMAKESLLNDTFASFGWVNDYRPATVEAEIELLIGRREIELRDEVLSETALAERFQELQHEKERMTQIVNVLLEQPATDLQRK